jgi:transcriptional regulator CBF1
VPNGSGEKAKGAILSRAVQYIHHLKENEARNIEKWTLEKLLMDQAMGDLQTQLEEIKRFYEEERNIRQRLENEIQGLRSGMHHVAMNVNQIQGQGMSGKEGESLKRDAAEGEGDRDGKRQRTE